MVKANEVIASLCIGLVVVTGVAVHACYNWHLSAASESKLARQVKSLKTEVIGLRAVQPSIGKGQVAQIGRE
jgi:hypothetical protein